MTPDHAETVALRALAWMAAHEDMAARFAGATGASLAEAPGRLAEAGYLSGILEFLVQDDAWVTEFCDAEGLPYDAPLRALQALPGGRREEWP
jgi:hypothetical protein